MSTDLAGNRNQRMNRTAQKRVSFAMKNKAAMSSKQREWVVAYLLLGPAFVCLFCFKILPLAMALQESFRTPIYLGSRFIGLSNYFSLFEDPFFWESLRVTLIFSLIVNPVQISISLGLSVLVARRILGIGLFRGIYFLPVAISMTVTAVLWGFMFNPQVGVINALLNRLTIPSQPFLMSTKQALASIIIMITWKGVGYWMIFLLAGLQGIPSTIYEAASIDGASRISTFLRITLPLLKRIIAFVIIADTAINFLLFAPIYLLTRGGPSGSTNLLMYEAYNSAFVYADLGRATAISTILIGIILVIALLQLRILKAGFEY